MIRDDCPDRYYISIPERVDAKMKTEIHRDRTGEWAGQLTGATFTLRLPLAEQKIIISVTRLKPAFGV
jgi:hypothetical protein